jgi:hypothetical protein
LKPISFLKASIIFLFVTSTTGCKPPAQPAEGAETEDILRAKRWSWKQFDQVDLYLYSFSPRITRGSSSAWTGKRCWYYKEAPRKQKMSTHTALSSAIRLNLKSLADSHLQKSYANSIFWQNIAVGAELSSGKAACTSAVIGTSVILAMPLLAGSVALQTTGAVLGCALSVWSFVDSSKRVGNNIRAVGATGNSSIDETLKMKSLDVDAMGRIKEAIFDNTQNHNGDECPKSNQIMQYLK